MPDLTTMTRQEKFLNGDTDLEPITRREHFYAGRESELPEGHQEPETREEWFIQKYRGGGGDVTVVPLSVTENGTYSEEGKAYSPVSVNVPLPQNAYLLKSVNTPTPIASFDDGEEMVMPSLKVAIEPVQDLSHGDPSPNNICPISGWDEAVVTRCGKNLFGGAYNEYFPIHFNEDKIVIASADAPSESTYPIQIAFFDENKTQLDYWGLSTQYSAINNRVARSFTLPKESYYLRYITQSSANYQIEFGETNSAYEPYNGQTYTIDLDGTRYGGEVDVVNGIVTPAPYYASYNGETLTGEWISDRDKYEVGATPTIGAQVVNIGASGTPVSIQPTAIKSLRGVNNVYANTGDIKDAEYFSKEV